MSRHRARRSLALRAALALRAGLVLALVAGLAACADAGPGSPTPDSPATDPAPTPASHPSGLVGLWAVTGDGVPDGTWLRLSAEHGLEYATGDAACPGAVGGGWAAAEGILVISHVNTATGHCGMELFGQPAAPWLAAAIVYRDAGAGWELLDDAGEVVARLALGGVVPVGVDDWYRKPPAVAGPGSPRFSDPAPLPAGLRPVTAEELVGRWVPLERYESDPYAEFAADGTWFGSDGCNGLSASWAVGSAGRFLSTTGGMTLIGCDGAGVPHWVSDAARAGFDGIELVLFDAGGSELGRLLPE